MKSSINGTYEKFIDQNRSLINEELSKISYELGKIEQDYIPIESYYNKIKEQVDNLSKIVSNFNSLQGEENLQKIRTIIKRNEKCLISNGFDFDTLKMLIQNIKDKTNSKDLTPVYNKEEIKIETEISSQISKEHKNYPFKWISFFKSGSWFMIKFKTIEVVEVLDFDFKYTKNSNNVEVTNKDNKFLILDPFSRTEQKNENPEKILFINSEKTGIGAAKTGKIIYAKDDFISNIKTELSEEIHSNFVEGRVKIFGKSHLLIKPNYKLTDELILTILD